MKLFKTIVEELNFPHNFQELFLPETTKEGDSVVIKTPDKSQICKVLFVDDTNSIILDAENMLENINEN